MSAPQADVSQELGFACVRYRVHAHAESDGQPMALGAPSCPNHLDVEMLTLWISRRNRRTNSVLGLERDVPVGKQSQKCPLTNHERIFGGWHQRIPLRFLLLNPNLPPLRLLSKRNLRAPSKDGEEKPCISPDLGFRRRIE